MTEVLDFLLTVVLLIFCAYVLIFGGIGALLARHRGGSAAMGFVVGLIPVLGWLVVLWLTRRAVRTISADEWLGPDPGTTGWSPDPRPPETGPPPILPSPADSPDNPDDY